mmetsp:Transcript_26673/g.71656  ORF Transcript_26673/g.71656 Transcript_26673/m.71656 type:complete len:226 (-) Transcript_26673:276-953(-)
MARCCTAASIIGGTPNLASLAPHGPPTTAGARTHSAAALRSSSSCFAISSALYFAMRCAFAAAASSSALFIASAVIWSASAHIALITALVFLPRHFACTVAAAQLVPSKAICSTSRHPLVRASAMPRRCFRICDSSNFLGGMSLLDPSASSITRSNTGIKISEFAMFVTRRLVSISICSSAGRNTNVVRRSSAMRLPVSFSSASIASQSCSPLTFHSITALLQAR